MAIRAWINIDETVPIRTHEDADPISGRPVVVLDIDGLAIHFSSFLGNEGVCRALDRLIEPLTVLRERAAARLVDDIVADLEAHPLVGAS